MTKEELNEEICYALYCWVESERNHEAAIKYNNGCFAEQAARWRRETKDSLMKLPENIRQEVIEKNPGMEELF